VDRKLGTRGRPHASQGRSRLHAPAGARDDARAPLTVKGAPRPQAPPRKATPRVLLFVRYGVPITIIAAGAIAISFGTEDSFYGGTSLIGAGLSVWLISWVYRIGVRGDADRDAEDEARRYYDRFGRWPDERR
jgi:hypothetical protein